MIWSLLLRIVKPVYLQGVADGRQLEREAIIKAASGLRATIPADYPKGAQASFADYLRVTAPERVTIHQDASGSVPKVNGPDVVPEGSERHGGDA